MDKLNTTESDYLREAVLNAVFAAIRANGRNVPVSMFVDTEYGIKVPGAIKLCLYYEDSNHETQEASLISSQDRDKTLHDILTKAISSRV
jgi:hypothetical protein